MITFDVSAAGTGSGQGWLAEGINPSGEITGEYIDSNAVAHGFVRSRSGAITTFDAPGAGTGSGQGTMPLTNNPAGSVTGSEIDASGVSHGFLRTP